MRFKDKFWMKIAWWLPKNLVYWATIRLLTYKDGEGPCARVTNALKRWEYV